MREADVARLLTIAAAVDNRNLVGAQGRAAVAAWGMVIGDLSYEECVWAIAEHRREAPGVYLEPGHVRELVLARRAEVSDALQGERAALEAFVRYTGASLQEAAERWSDEAWCSEQIEAARRRHRAKALEAGA